MNENLTDKLAWDILNGQIDQLDLSRFYWQNSKKIDVNKYHPQSGLTLFQLAVRKGLFGLADYMYKTGGANIHAPSKDNLPFMHFLINQPDEDASSGIKFLTERKVSTEVSSDSKYAPPLISAVTQGKIKCATTLLNAGAYINVRHKEMNALFYALASKQNTQMLQLLIEAGIDKEATVKGNTALFYACKENLSEPALTLIRAGARVNVRDSKGYTPLWFAAGNNNRNLVKALLDAGADPNPKDNDGVLLLPGVAGSTTDLEIMKLLLSKAQNLSESDFVLLFRGADCNPNPTVKDQLFHLFKQEATQRGLIKPAAASPPSPPSSDSEKDSPRNLSSGSTDSTRSSPSGSPPSSPGSSSPTGSPKREYVIPTGESHDKELISRIRDDKKATPQELIDIFEKGITLKVYSVFGSTVFHEAVAACELELTKHILSRIPNIDGIPTVNLPSKKGFTALQRILDYVPNDNVLGNKMIKLLIDNGARLDLRDANGRTPLQQARDKGNNVAERMLIAAGAEKFEQKQAADGSSASKSGSLVHLPVDDKSIVLPAKRVDAMYQPVVTVSDAYSQARANNPPPTKPLPIPPQTSNGNNRLVVK